MKSTAFIHVGYPKCASTTLQDALFVRHPEIYSLAKCRNPESHYQLTPEIKYLYKMIKNYDEINFDISSAQDLLKTALNQIPKNQIPVFGLEGFSDIYHCKDRGLVAKRLKKVFSNFFDEVKIIIVIRNQYDILRSLYDMRPWPPPQFGFK